MPITFRAARPPDIEALLPMARAFRAIEGGPWDELTARAALVGLMVRREAGAAWLIEDEPAQPVGYLVVTLGYSLEYGGRGALLDELYIEPSHRGRGIGRRALQVAESYCQMHEAHMLHLILGPADNPARRAYRRYGFAATDRLLLSRSVSTICTLCTGGDDASGGSGVQ